MYPFVTKPLYNFGFAFESNFITSIAYSDINVGSLKEKDTPEDLGF